MEEWMEKILQDLNRISRVAVIEQAFDVECMLRNYAKILKYRWGHIDKDVPMQMEYLHLEMLLSYYQIQYNRQLEFDLWLEPSIKEIMIPHYTLLGIVGSILEAITFTADGKVECRVYTSELKKEEVEQTFDFFISIQLKGNMDLNEVIARSQNNSVSYDDLEGACCRWKQRFSDSSIKLLTGAEHSIEIQLFGRLDEV